MLLQAIETRFAGPTNTRGAAIVATCGGGSIRMGYRHELNSTENHREAARRLAAKMKWTCAPNHFVTGATKKGMCHVFTKAIDVIQGIREMIREGRNNGNPWRNPEVQALVEFLADFHGIDKKDV